ncbi:MAG: PPC domain-containing protein, partial [Planctomycetaceae bacterium]
MQKLTPPCEVHGQFYPQRDVDWFTFDAKQNDMLSIELISQRLGMPTDASMLLQQEVRDEQGNLKLVDLQFVDDVIQPNNNNNQSRAYRHEFDDRTTDPSILFKAPADGTYRLMIRDGLSALKSDPRLTWRLVVRAPQPDFRIAASPARSNAAFQLRKGGRETLNLVVFRRDGFDGEIRASVSGLPEGVTSDEIVSGPGSSTGTLVLTAADSAKGTSILRVLAKAVLNGQEVQREARYAAAAGVSQANQPNASVPSLKARLVSAIQVSVSELEAAPQTLTIGNGQPLETSRGGVLKIPYQV